MTILCGWASQSEKGTINGKKGDQTGKEVKIGNYYNFGQDKIIRFRNSARGKKAAKAQKAFCENDNIGYGQADRTSLFNQCRKLKWDINRIKEIPKCNCDCSELCVCSINMAYGKEVLNSYCTTHSFYKETVKKHPRNFRCVKVNCMKKAGDMPLKAGKHIIMVLESEKK